MPELPEVETIRRGLLAGDACTPSLIGQRVCAVSILWERTVAYPSLQEFANLIQGTVVSEINRKGKFLLITVDDSFVIFHLRMSGDLRMRRESDEPSQHDRLILHFCSGWKLTFTDTRKFGRVWLTPDLQTVIGKLGPEPLAAELTNEIFHEMLLARDEVLEAPGVVAAFIDGHRQLQPPGAAQHVERGRRAGGAAIQVDVELTAVLDRLAVDRGNDFRLPASAHGAEIENKYDDDNAQEDLHDPVPGVFSHEIEQSALLAVLW